MYKKPFVRVWIYLSHDEKESDLGFEFEVCPISIHGRKLSSKDRLFHRTEYARMLEYIDKLGTMGYESVMARKFAIRALKDRGIEVTM